jgi:hypothetical protein
VRGNGAKQVKYFHYSGTENCRPSSSDAGSSSSFPKSHDTNKSADKLETKKGLIAYYDSVLEDIQAQKNSLDTLINNSLRTGTDGTNWSDISATAGGAILGAGIVGFGASKITQSVTERNFELSALKSGDAAVTAWVENALSSIQCTVGGKVVGSYGDTITLK